ncbi:hypothetical protein V6N12_068929 [Hibiscus sabdariffa]|uniref:Uncharacterized protein n=1 Tax=Hibiscus sabdariffa TaxID=183260 RepID=A0ABR2CA73_9ROSI
MMVVVRCGLYPPLPPHRPVLDGGIAVIVEDNPRRQCRSVVGVVDEAKLSVLETCALGWVKEGVSIRVLAQEMSATGLDGFEVMWAVGSMVLLAFPDGELRQSLLSQAVMSAWFSYLEEWSASIGLVPQHSWVVGQLFAGGCGYGGANVFLVCVHLNLDVFEVVEFSAQGKVYPIVVQEAELVQVPAVEQREVVADVVLGDRS